MKGQVSLVVLGMLLVPAAFAQDVRSPAAAPESAVGTPPRQHPDLSPQDDPGFNRGINAQELTPRAPAAPAPVASGPAAHDTHRQDMPQSGSTGPATSGVLAQIDRNSMTRAPNQTEAEMTATALLNRFSQLGFAGVREFRRDGDHYVAQAQTMDGTWVKVTIDPGDGNVRADGPAG